MLCRDKIILFFLYDFLKAMRHREDCRAVVLYAEIIATSLVATANKGGHLIERHMIDLFKQ